METLVFAFDAQILLNEKKKKLNELRIQLNSSNVIEM